MEHEPGEDGRSSIHCCKGTKHSGPLGKAAAAFAAVMLSAGLEGGSSGRVKEALGLWLERGGQQNVSAVVVDVLVWEVPNVQSYGLFSSVLFLGAPSGISSSSPLAFR